MMCEKNALSSEKSPACLLCVCVCVSTCLLGCEWGSTQALMMIKYVVNVGGYFSQLAVVKEAVVYCVFSQLCVCVCFNWTSLSQSPGDRTHLLFLWLRTTDGLVGKHTHTHTPQTATGALTLIMHHQKEHWTHTYVEYSSRSL